MKVIKTTAPFIKTSETVTDSMRRVIICLFSILIFSAFFYGMRVIVNAAISVSCCLIFEYIAARIARLPSSLKDLSAAVTGIMITLLSPAGIPKWTLILMSAFAIFIAKAPFGGLGHNPFNPSACAVSFITLCWPEHMFLYPASPQILPIFGSINNTASFSEPVLTALRNYSKPPYRMFDIFFGAVPNKTGTGCFMLIFACMLLLIVKKVLRWRITLSCVTAFTLLAMLFPRVGSGYTSAFYELFSGYVLFAAVFMLTDPSTSPKSRAGQYIYGAACACVIMVMRRYGIYNEGTCFAIIICNAGAPALDRAIASARERRLRIDAKTG